jgi:hypothetical protein
MPPCARESVAPVKLPRTFVGVKQLPETGLPEPVSAGVQAVAAVNRLARADRSDVAGTTLIERLLEAESSGEEPLSEPQAVNKVARGMDNKTRDFFI